MFNVKTTYVFVVIIVGECLGQFKFPDAIMEAYTPKGFRVFIQHVNHMDSFEFHGNLNKNISINEPGEYIANITQYDDKLVWSYSNPDLQLKVGDTIYYWYFIVHNGFGYRRDNQQWTVKELLPLKEKKCNQSETWVFGKTLVCVEEVLLDDKFDGDEIDKSKWTVEHFIPTKSPDFEFVSYQNRKDVCFVEDSKLFLRPKVALTEKELRGTLDLSKGCTRSSPEECVYTQYGAYLIPPVTSARLVSKLKFYHGRIKIRAKLPEGDWIYPQIYLESVDYPERKIWIAYARGNEMLTKNGTDIGSRFLSGGVVVEPKEPERNKYLKSVNQSTPFFSDYHTYEVIWTRLGGLKFLLDGVEYGQDASPIISNFYQARLVLGVGVGGINDFPDFYKSNGQDKPWINKDRYQVKNFYASGYNWIQTWKGDAVALKVDSVEITAN